MTSAITPDGLAQFLKSPEGKDTGLKVIKQLAELQREHGYVSQVSFTEMRKLIERITTEATAAVEVDHGSSSPANDGTAVPADRARRRVG